MSRDDTLQRQKLTATCNRRLPPGPQKPLLALPKSRFKHALMPAPSLPTLLRLPKRIRLEIAESLWLSVADEEKLPVPEGHRKVLDARLASYRSGKSRPIPHAELMRRLRGS